MSEPPHRLRWSVPDPPPTKHRLRDSTLVYGVLALLVVAVSWASGGPVGRAAVIAPACAVVAIAWNLARPRLRRRAPARKVDG